mmetsp:Transcript_56105/g.156318  ORF Transcript_56105/g.156318 Transcript_56105/m.156318 type:complete len:464 (-) Transcript_56105:357-1748(-)|eukprot:CAMPEP_0117475502 /NCGR_PEP_ID=MMETSP0784-20121206/9829_1 /TAXON_ID=39447 /ORGANISM="" /LENGTH=463 /DNA_ID=CAMNT_0005269753 /DNA_START=102 /DNA_END=1493 /DNA_ORIENTATION=-
MSTTEPLTDQGDGPASAATATEPGVVSGWARCLASVDRFFCITERGSSLAQEFWAGSTGFMATSNNFALNASILSALGFDANMLVISSAFISGIASIASGISSNLPVAIATSVGPNLLMAGLCSSGAYSQKEVLAIAMACGFLLTLLSITPVLRWALRLVPLYIKCGLVIGTGLLTALKGLEGIVITNQFTLNLDYLLSLDGVVAGILLVFMATLLHWNTKGAMLMGMLGGTFVYWLLSQKWPSSFVMVGSLHGVLPDCGVLASARVWLQVVSLTLMVLLSISGGVIGSARMAGLLQNGDAPGSLRIYIVCGVATMLSACLGSSPLFVSMSASAGVRDGGRTGLMSVVIGVYALLTAFLFAPIMSAIPKCALAPVLILVGAHMFREVREVDWADTRRALPAFLCAILQPFTGSVGDGIYAGLACSFVLFLTTGAFMAIFPERQQPAECQISLRASAVQDHVES